MKVNGGHNTVDPVFFLEVEFSVDTPVFNGFVFPDENNLYVKGVITIVIEYRPPYELF